MNGIVKWGDEYWVCAPIPERHFDWFTLYNKLRKDGYDVRYVPNPPAALGKPFWHVNFDTFLEAFDFKMKHVD